jgi:hypothetical protein
MSHFHLGATSGLIATAAANGVIFAWRNPSSTKKQYIKSVRAVGLVTTLPSAEQETALALRQATFVDDYTDGTDLAALYKPTWLDKQRATAALMIPSSVLTAGCVRIATTAALTAGATPPTFFGADRAWDGVVALVAGAAVEKAKILIDWKSPHLAADSNGYDDVGNMILGEDEGFVIRMPIAIANSLVARVHVDVEWME